MPYHWRPRHLSWPDEADADVVRVTLLPPADRLPLTGATHHVRCPGLPEVAVGDFQFHARLAHGNRRLANAVTYKARMSGSRIFDCHRQLHYLC